MGTWEHRAILEGDKGTRTPLGDPHEYKFRQKPYALVAIRPFRIPQWVKQEGFLAFPDPSIERIFSRYILFSRNENVSIFQLLIKSITFFRLDSRLLGASLHLSAGLRRASSLIIEWLLWLYEQFMLF